MSKIFLTPDELVDRYASTISLRTLANWRSSKQGPPFVKIGGRVMYPVAEVERWEHRRMVNAAANDNRK